MKILNNLFSMFDPSSYYMSWAWLIMVIPVVLIPNNLMKLSTKMNFFHMMAQNILEKEISQTMSNKKPYSISTMKNLLVMIFLMNFLSLFQYNFTPSAHLTVSFFLAITFWLSLMLWNMINNSKNFLAHLTPTGTPISLMNFMALIELVSNLIRPITLSVRLSANMTAGHLLISLLSEFSMSNFIIMSFPVTILLLILEMGVCFIQAYVLSTLLILYQNESF